MSCLPKRASNASKEKSNKTNTPLNNRQIQLTFSRVERYLFLKSKPEFVTDPRLPEIIFPTEENISPETFFSFASNQDYSDCREAGGTVVSNVFCLPTNYRKDVLPPTGSRIHLYFIKKNKVVISSRQPDSGLKHINALARDRLLVPLDTKDPISVFDHEEAIAFLVTKGGRR